MHDVVLALTLDEINPRNTLLAGEAAHRRTEAIADRRQRRGRGDRQPQPAVHKPHQPRRVLQLRHIDIEVHPIDALRLKTHMLGQDISHSARYVNMGSGRTRASQANQTASSGFIHRTGTPVTVSHPADQSPPTQASHSMPRRAGAQPR